jgi:hypothetical protein
MMANATRKVFQMYCEPRGHFPFGRPNTVREMRMPVGGTAVALVIGVYPSAFHVTWRHEGKRIAALAVDVEPAVFWNGKQPTPSAVFEDWKASVDFRDEWGMVSEGHNGPSGDVLENEILQPLGFDPEAIAFTDAVPWYFVKGGKGSQGAAIKKRFAPFAVELGLHPGSLPSRPSQADLVKIVTDTERRESLRDEITRAGAPLLITLGSEALAAVRGIAESVAGVQTTIQIDGYGAVGEITVAGRTMAFRPLAHPGLLRQKHNKDPWKKAHLHWRAALERASMDSA